MKGNYYANTYSNTFSIINQIINQLLKSFDQKILHQGIDSLKNQQILMNMHKCQEFVIQSHYFTCRKQPQKFIQSQTPTIINQNTCKSLKKFKINYKVQKQQKQKCNKTGKISFLIPISNYRRNSSRNSSRKHVLPVIELLNQSMKHSSKKKINPLISLRKQEGQDCQEQFINYMRSRQIKIQEINNIFKQRQQHQILNKKQAGSSSYLTNKLKFFTQYNGNIVPVKQNKCKPLVEQNNSRVQISFKLRQVVQYQQPTKQAISLKQDSTNENVNSYNYKQQEHEIKWLNQINQKLQNSKNVVSKSQTFKQNNFIFKKPQYKIKKKTFPYQNCQIDQKNQKNIYDKNNKIIDRSIKCRTMNNSPIKLDYQSEQTTKQRRLKKKLKQLII